MQEQTNMNFTSDDNVKTIVEAFALDAVDVANNNFGIKLDWSEDSVKGVETILDMLNKSLQKAPPPEENLWSFSKMFGSYIGEVYCRNHKASWGMITLNNESFPGLEVNHKALFWPWSKVFKRITAGDEENIWHYYQQMMTNKI